MTFRGDERGVIPDGCDRVAGTVRRCYCAGPLLPGATIAVQLGLAAVQPY